VWNSAQSPDRPLFKASGRGTGHRYQNFYGQCNFAPWLEPSSSCNLLVGKREWTSKPWVQRAAVVGSRVWRISSARLARGFKPVTFTSFKSFNCCRIWALRWVLLIQSQSYELFKMMPFRLVRDQLLHYRCVLDDVVGLRITTAPWMPLWGKGWAQQRRVYPGLIHHLTDQAAITKEAVRTKNACNRNTSSWSG